MNRGTQVGLALLTATMAGWVARTPLRLVPATCSDMRIEVTATSFPGAFDIRYEVVGPSAVVCQPFNGYSFDTPGAYAVALHPAGAAVAGIETLAQPLRFVRARANGPDRQLSGIDLVPGSKMDTPSSGSVPAGEFELTLRWFPTPCPKGYVAEACISVSNRFHLEAATKHAIED
jgi:hypothetical protein